MRQFSLTALLIALATPAFADDFAVLIGVERYDAFGRVNAAADITDAADDLREAGYIVQSVPNGGSGDLRRVLDDLAEDALDAERLVVALSGRFATDGQRTWFLARDTEAPTPFGISDAVSVDTIMQVLARAPGQAVLVLGYDQRGFSSFGRYLREGVGQLDVPQGVTVIYGEPDRVDNVLTGAITETGADLLEAVRDDGRLNVLGYQPRTLVLQPADSSDRPVAPIVAPTLRAWNNAQAANTADAYRNFIFAFPRSPFVDEARARLDAIESDPQRLAEQAEDALNLTRNERRKIQSDLTLLGYDTRGVDGIFGNGSRAAIRNWQGENGIAQTSFLDATQISLIDAQASRRAEEQERKREEAERLDREYWRETGARGTEDGYRAYLERYPEGIYAEEARAALAETDNAAARATEEALNINPTLRRLIESRLASLGFDPGAVDGRFDAAARRAISDYQSSRGLTATGYIDQPTLARLLADTF